ncbi:MAG: FecR domain-containing protein, partial [Bacteroidales bacterium]|nr:FecR domain-containing protein [Bacteroidales bacterium]
ASIAAMLVFFVGFYSLLGNDAILNTAGFGEHKTLALLDGSQVILNSKSGLNYSKKDWKKNRDVYLNGEAFFEIKKGSKFNVKTGETNENKKIAKYQNITFEIINNNYVNINGSLHKYSNKGIHNYDDFDLEKLFNTIKDLYYKFNINPCLTPINNIEFAVNINTSFNPKSFIQHNIINYKGKQASINTFKGKGYLKEFITNRYIVKVYDKGLQFKQSKNIFRFEVKVLKMEHLKNIGIKNLADILKPRVLNDLGSLLVETFNNLLIFDNTVNFDELTNKEQKIYQNGINPMFWENLKPNANNYEHGNNDNQYKKDRKTYYRKLEQFKNLIKKYNDNTIQNKLAEQIKNKWNGLINIDIEKRDKLTDFSNEISRQKKGQINRVPIEVEKSKKGQINTSNIVSICYTSDKKCLVTGLDISMQKETSKFMSISGLKYYKKNNPEIYKILEKRLSNKWKTKSTDIQIKEIAHSIRNEYFNQLNNSRNKIKREYNKINSMPCLFDNTMFIDKRKLQFAGLI